ncbi:hypothetical protein [Paenibacillus sp. AGC30]
MTNNIKSNMDESTPGLPRVSHEADSVFKRIRLLKTSRSPSLANHVHGAVPVIDYD